jgi:hypothetical protein
MRDRQLYFVASRRVAVMACAAAGVWLASGCWVDSHHCDGDCAPPVPSGAGGGGGSGGSTGKVVEAVIDTGQTLTTDPGKGAGVFIDYAEEGHWHVYTACDSAYYGDPCLWNVIATVPLGAAIEDATIYSAEASDGDVIYKSGNTLELEVATWSDFDGMRFRTTPGEVVRFEVYLDGLRDPRYIYWFGDGAIHKGAPTNPIDLKPSSP